MLESMRNQAQSWIAKVILVGIALSFALWGVGDYFMGNQVQTVAEVDGKPIVDSAFKQAYERQINNYRAMLGSQFSKELIAQFNLKDETIQTLINRKLMLDEAYQTGLTAPEASLVASLKANPAFQSPNGFDASRYKIITRNMGFRTTRDYEDEQRLNLMVDALQKAVVGSAQVSDKDIHDHFSLEFEQRVLSAVIVDPASMLKKITMDETQARDYYEANLDKYRSPLKVKLTAVEISPETFASDMVIDAADVEAAYNDRKSEFAKPEQRRASHILIRNSKDADEATRSTASKKIEAVKARLAAGEDFATVAKDTSDDITATKGGDLGFFPRGAMLPEFEEAVFNLAKDEISDIIETTYGFHIIQLKDVKIAEVTPLKDVYDSLAANIRIEKAKEEAYKVSQELDNTLGMEDSLSVAAKSLGLTSIDIGPISAAEVAGNALLGSDKALSDSAFSSLPGESINIQELDDGRFVSIEVLERIEPDTLSFADAATQIYQDARNAKAQAQAKTLAKEILAKANSETLDQLAQSYGQPKYISKPVRNNGIGDEADWLVPDMLEQAFKTAKGSAISSLIEVSKGFAVVQVKDVMAPAESEFEAQKKAMRLEVEKSKGAVRFARWMATVRDNHDIIIHEDVLERL